MGASKQTTAGTTTQKTGPWQPAQSSLKFGLGEARKVFDERMGQTFFPGQTYTDFSPESEAALTGMTTRAQAGSPLLRGAQGMMGDTLSGNYLTQQNPFFRSMVDRAAIDVMPHVNAAFGKAGRTGSTDHAYWAARGMGDAVMPLAYADYGRERGYQMDAAGMAPMLAQADYADLERLGGVGAAREGQEQRGIDEAMARYGYGQDQRSRALAEMQGFTVPVASLGSKSSGTSSTTQTTTPNPVNTAIGAGMMGASMFTGAGPLAGAGASFMSGMGNVGRGAPWGYGSSWAPWTRPA